MPNRTIIRSIKRWSKSIVLLVPWAKLIHENLVVFVPGIRCKARHRTIRQRLLLAVAAIENQLPLGSDGAHVIEISRNDWRVHLLH